MRLPNVQGAEGSMIPIHDDGVSRVLHAPGRNQPFTVQRRNGWQDRHQGMDRTMLTLKFCTTEAEALALVARERAKGTLVR